MEIVLNLVWMLLAAVLLRLWLHHAPRASASRRMQAVALLMLLVILFPVISVTDDLAAVENPAILECCARRHHAAFCPHSIHTAVAALPLPIFAEAPFAVLHLATPGVESARLVAVPALTSIQNRPPPAA